MLKVAKSSALSRLRRGSVDAFILHGLGVVLLFLMHTVVARAVGPSGYGTFSHAIAIATTLGIVTALGWPQTLLRLLSQYRAAENWSSLRGLLRAATLSTLLLSSAAALILLVVASSWVTNPQLNISLKFAAGLLPLLSFVRVRRLSLQALLRIRASIIPDEIVLPVLVITGIWVLSIHRLVDGWLLYVVAAAIVFAFSTVWLRRAVPPEAKRARAKYDARLWLGIAIAMLFTQLSHVAIKQTDLIVLGAMRPHDEVGLYSAARRLALLNTFTLNAILSIAPALIATAHSGGRGQEVRTIMRVSMLWSTLGALPLYLVILAFPEWLLSFFGEEFRGGANLLRILGTGHFVNALTGPVGIALLMTDRERLVAGVTAAAAIGNVVGHVLAISVWGAIGAAIVTAATVVVLNLSLLLAYLSGRKGEPALAAVGRSASAT